jgi:cytidylate kinase
MTAEASAPHGLPHGLPHGPPHENVHAGAPAEARPLVTIAALYGAGGSVVGPAVATRLGVVFMGREIPLLAAGRSGAPPEAVAEVAEGERPLAERLRMDFGDASIIGAALARTSAEPAAATERRLRSCIEEFLVGAATHGGVLLGHGGMVVLRSVPWALHVLLCGPSSERVRQAMALQGQDRRTAEKRQRAEDRARIGYVRRAYGADGLDPCWYHLILDSTALTLDDCVEQIAAAAHARLRKPRPSPPI